MYIIGKLKVVFARTINENWINSVPSPIAMLIQYLFELGKINVHQDATGRKYVFLQDLVPYRGYKIPNNYYGLAVENEYLTTVSLDEIIKWAHLDHDEASCDLKWALEELAFGDLYRFDRCAYYDEIFSEIRRRLNNDEFRDKISSIGLLPWLIPEEVIGETLNTIGSAEWAFFTHANTDGITMIDEGHVRGFSRYFADTARDDTWIRIFALLGELHVSKMFFVAHSLYHIDENLFQSLVKNKLMFHNHDEYKDLQYVRDYEYNNCLYMYKNESGSIELNRNTFICRDCGQLFYLSKSDQTFFSSKGLKMPKRCVICRKKNK